MMGNRYFGRRLRSSLRLPALCAGLMALGLGINPDPVDAQLPRDQVHISLSLGGYVRVGVGYTRWIEEHHSLEFTAFPFAYPGDGLSMALKAGYNWIPSDELWRAKLGGNATLLIHRPRGDGGWFTPLLSFTPGLQYAPVDERCIRVDLWMSYYINEKVFAPTGIEVMYGLRK